MKKLPTLLLKNPANAEIVRYLQEQTPSAHSDVASEMFLAAKELRDIHSFAPDPSSYSYELLHTSHGVVFAVSAGQSTILLRRPADRLPSTFEAHGKPFPPLGPAWVALPAFQPGIPLADWRKTLRTLMKAAAGSALAV